MAQFFHPSLGGLTSTTLLTAVRRLIIVVQREVGVSKWCYGGFVMGPAVMTFGGLLPKSYSLPVTVAGLLILICALFKAMSELDDDGMALRKTIASNDAKMIDHGIPNPSLHRKVNPELVAAYETLVIEMGVPLDPLKRKTKEQKDLHDLALMMLSGVVPVEDLPLIVSVVGRGVTRKDEVLAVVDDMKANGYPLAEGAL